MDFSDIKSYKQIEWGFKKAFYCIFTELNQKKKKIKVRS